MMFPMKVSINGTIINVLLLALISIQYTEAWTAMGYYHDKAYPGKCKIKDNLILKPGEIDKIPGECVQITCANTDGLAHLLGCGLVTPPDNCVLGEYVNIDAPYDACCKRKFICDKTKATKKNENKSLELNTAGNTGNLYNKEL